MSSVVITSSPHSPSGRGSPSGETISARMWVGPQVHPLVRGAGDGAAKAHLTRAVVWEERPAEQLFYLLYDAERAGVAGYQRAAEGGEAAI